MCVVHHSGLATCVSHVCVSRIWRVMHVTGVSVSVCLMWHTSYVSICDIHHRCVCVSYIIAVSRHACLMCVCRTFDVRCVCTYTHRRAQLLQDKNSIWHQSGTAPLSTLPWPYNRLSRFGFVTCHALSLYNRLSRFGFVTCHAYTPSHAATNYSYGVALVSRIDQIIGPFAKEPYKTDDVMQKWPII